MTAAGDTTYYNNNELVVMAAARCRCSHITRTAHDYRRRRRPAFSFSFQRARNTVITIYKVHSYIILLYFIFFA